MWPLFREAVRDVDEADEKTSVHTILCEEFAPSATSSSLISSPAQTEFCEFRDSFIGMARWAAIVPLSFQKQV